MKVIDDGKTTLTKVERDRFILCAGGRPVASHIVLVKEECEPKPQLPRQKHSLPLRLPPG